MGDWLTIIIVLLILGILLDGWRRMRNAQKDSLKVSRSMRKSTSLSAGAKDEYPSAELPNGGARVIHREARATAAPASRSRPASAAKKTSVEQTFSSEPEPLEAAAEQEVELESLGSHGQPQSETFDEPWETPAPEPAATPAEKQAPSEEVPGQDSRAPVSERKAGAPTGRGRIPQQVALNLDESVPILMETEETAEDERSERADRIEPTFGGPLDEDEDLSAPEPVAAPDRSGLGKQTSALGASLGNKARKAKEALSTKLASSSLMNPAAESGNAKTHAKAEPAPSRRAPEAKPAPQPQPVQHKDTSPPPAPEEVLVVNVMAPKGQEFRGDALLDALLRAGLRYGDMNIFHRYERNGSGPILFSLANMVKPGTFDLDTMDDFSTPGVSLFMTLPLEGERFESLEVFELMLDSAQSMVNDLGGELKDENRSVMTRQTMEHCRQRIHEFERKQLSRVPG